MDDELKALFRELRAHERHDAPDLEAVLARERHDPPDLEAVLARARPPGRRRPPGPARLAVLAAAGLVALLALLLWPRDARRVPGDVARATILEWRAPTDVLLRTPGGGLLRELPALDRSLIDPGRSP